MKSILIVAAALCLAAPVLAGTPVRDSSGAWSCQKASGEVISYYWPAGRVPTTAEQVQCAQAGGKAVKPTGPRKAPIAPERTR